MRSIASEHISTIINFLNKKAEYAVLRNFEGLPDNNKSRDIDIIITRKSYRSIKAELVKLIDYSGWKIMTYLNSDRLITYVCAKIDDNGYAQLVQWDFFMNTSVFGVLLMDADEFLKHRKFNSFLYHVDVDCCFLDKYLYNRAVGNQYPEKYKDTRKQAEKLPVVEEKIASIYGCRNVEACDQTSGRKLLLRAVWWNARHRLGAFVADVLHFSYAFFKNYLSSNTGFTIGFTGPDGSGKTTVINLLIENLGDVFKTAHAYYHFRPTLLKNLGEAAHTIKLKKEVDRNFDQPHRGGKTNAFSSIARLLYYSIDYIAGYFIKIKSACRITQIVIFDRYYTDIIADSRRSRIYLNHIFLYWYGRLFIPSLDYNILLTANTQIILARKQELNRKEIENINQKLDYLSNKKGYLLIWNESKPETSISKILTYILKNQHQKNIKRI